MAYIDYFVLCSARENRPGYGDPLLNKREPQVAFQPGLGTESRITCCMRSFCILFGKSRTSTAVLNTCQNAKTIKRLVTHLGKTGRESMFREAASRQHGSGRSQAVVCGINLVSVKTAESCGNLFAEIDLGLYARFPVETKIMRPNLSAW